MKPLDGIRVLDLSATLPGPYCTQLLADLGAFNRGKRSVALDLKASGDRERLYELLTEIDVVVEGFRPGVAARLGVDAQSVRGRHERIVYCSISGAGQTGPLAAAPGHDANYLGMSGALTSSDGPTPVPWLPYADLGSGALAAVAILAALLRRRETGTGATIDLAMLDVCVSWAVSRHAGGGDELNVSPAHTVLIGSDGRAFTLGAIEDRFWSAFCEVAEDERLSDARFATHKGRARHRVELAALLAEIAATRPATEWLEACAAADVPAGPVAESFEEALSLEQIADRGIVRLLGDELESGSDPESSQGLTPRLLLSFPAVFDGNLLSAGTDVPPLPRA
jgi:crotonobetainyl-CoA:carnitine CoA-transferase CaiB-like acyl-CoA transferase